MWMKEFYIYNNIRNLKFLNCVFFMKFFEGRIKSFEFIIV